MGFPEYINGFNGHAKKYFPSGQWTPADQAVYGPEDPYRVPQEEAERLRFNAIKYQFVRHYEHNRMYRTFCQQTQIAPDDIRSLEDLGKIPLVPSEFFKDHPSGKDFALWLASIHTGELPKIRISGKNPSHDDVIDSFNDAGMAVFYSSGTGGRHTFIPRDMRSFHMNEYALAKCIVSMFYPYWKPEMQGYLMLPNPFKTNLFAGRLGTIVFDITQNVQVAIDRKIDTEIIRISMSDDEGLKGKVAQIASRRMNSKMVDNIINWIENNQKVGREMAIIGAPVILYNVIEQLKKEGRTFDLGEKALVLTGGGWKVHEHRRLPDSEFRKEVKEVLGIPEERCLDLYGMVESNGWMTQCPEGHYFHIPTTYLHPMVLDEDRKPLGYGEYGRFAFLDGSMYGYPGFIVTGDDVRMLERCPVCGRPGPVLEPNVKRAKGKETRGCAEEVRRTISSDMAGD